MANAVGAATGKIMETVKVLVKPGKKMELIWCMPPGRKYFEDLQEAIDYALENGKKHASMAAQKQEQI